MIWYAVAGYLVKFRSRSAQTAASGAGSAGNNGTSEADRPVPLLESASGEITFFLKKKALLIENKIKIFT